MKFIDEGRGLDFHSWIDALIRLPQDSVIGNPLRDLDKSHEKFWINWLIERNVAPIPEIVKYGRGIGSWSNASNIIIMPEIETKLEGFGHLFWKDIPKYVRLYPFNNSRKNLKFFYDLFRDIDEPWKNTYVTSICKSWARDVVTSLDVLYSEVEEVTRHNQYNKIIYLFREPLVKLPGEFLDYPENYSMYNGHGWKRFRNKFRALLE